MRETLLCPTELGVPNQRRRYYLLAGRDVLAAWPAREGCPLRVSDVLEHAPPADVMCDPSPSAGYRHALNVVDPQSPEARTSCFTSAYGRSPVRSGSYLATPDGLRRFTPAEILRLLDYPTGYALPPGLPVSTGWRLAGNSVSVRAVRWVLSGIPGLRDGTSDWRPAGSAVAPGPGQ
jgi:hypothetical protein